MNISPRDESIESMIGETFGEWKVLEHLGSGKMSCQCSCGVIKAVTKFDLLNHRSTSCGHDTTGLKDLTGQQFGEWTVLHRENGKWLCRCSCGAERLKSSYELTSGQAKSCGHNYNKPKDLTGQIFGEWKVVSKAEGRYWNCVCSCGKISKIQRYSLTSGRSKSCGHIRTDNTPNTKLELHTPTDSTPNGIKSAEEIELLDYIKSLCNEYGYTIEERNKEILNTQEMDIYIPEIKVGFEYNKSLEHSDKFKTPGYHLQKTIDCFNKGIRLIHLFDYEFFEEKQKSRIQAFIKDAINPNKERVYARKCEITEITGGQAKKFIEEYHIQGYATSKINLGLTYKNELIGVMTFGIPRFSTTTEYELVRLVWKSGIIVIGGAEKLFKYFIKNYTPNSIVSYCDISKFSGKTYNKLGFKFEAVTDPNYKWVNTYKHVALSRYQTQKHKLVEQGLGNYEQSEVEIMQGLEFCKIYDCGNRRFIWRPK